MLKVSGLGNDVNQWFVDNVDFGICVFSRIQVLNDKVRVFYFEFENELFLDLPAHKCEKIGGAFEAFKESYLNANFNHLAMGA